MLRAAGVDAHVALLNTGPGPDSEKTLPGLGGFDHAIVYVPGEPSLWIDPTDEFSRVGQLPIPDEGRLALVAGPDTTDHLRIPAATSADNRTVETREFFLADEGEAQVVETTETWGSIELGYRRNYSQASEEQIREWLESYAKETYLAEAIANIEYTEPDDLSVPFQVRFEATGVKRGWTDVGDAGVAILTPSLLGALPQIFKVGEEESELGGEGPGAPSTAAAPEKRETDLELPQPFVVEWNCRVVPPPGFRPGDLPEGGTDRLGPATLSKEFKAAENNVVTATLRFDTGKRRFTPDEVEEVRQGIEKLQESPPILVRFEQTGEAHLSAGRIREALAEFRHLATLHPKEALHRTQTTRALLEGSMGEAAREEARRAIELEPTSAITHRTLGWILQHDLVGRRFKKGSDLAGAVAAYRKALELDASDIVTRADLAILLEHDTEGMRYSSKARLDEAIAEYRVLQDELDSSSPIFNNLPIALMWARRFEELKEFVRRHEPNELLLVAVAATDSPEAAVQEARKVFPDGESRRSALLNAGNSLIQLRLYAEATTLLTAAAKGAPNAAALLARADMIRKTKRNEDLSYPETDPRSVVKRLFITTFLDTRGDKILALFAREAREKAEKDEEFEKLKKTQRRLHSQLQTQEILPEVAVDIAVANFQMYVDGDDSLGYRIRVRGASPTGSLNEIYFVVIEDGEYRILVAGETLGSIGKEALQRAERGDLASARRWLDWAREEQSLPGGDAPFLGPAFPRFWTKGSDAGLDEIRHAAASLMATTSDAESAIPILQEGRKRAASEDARTKFDLALAQAFMRLDRPADVLPIAQHLLQVKADSFTAFMYLVGALGKLRKRDELKKAARERLELLPDDPWALRALAILARVQENYEEAERLHQKLVELGKAEAVDFNEHAWFSLFADEVTEEEHLEEAQRAVLLTQNQSDAPLHTLASLYAELGRPTEALEVILQAIEVKAVEEPEPIDWYVFGRIAEQYGEKEAAVAAYRKVEAPEDEQDLPGSTYLLAQKRLALLEP
jgi:tetratricopeptide (TPR) repeat protein